MFCGGVEALSGGFVVAGELLDSTRSRVESLKRKLRRLRFIDKFEIFLQ